MKYGLQLYTIRDVIKDKDSFIFAMRSIKEMGYDGVEFAGYYGLDAVEIKTILEETGLEAFACHESFFRFRDEWDDVYQKAKALGIKKLVMSSSPCETIAQVNETIAVLQEAKAKIDIDILYHNHDREFYQIEAILPIVKLKEIVKLELDTFWSYCAGEDSSSYIIANSTQIGAIHIKDGIKAERKPLALGEGDNPIEDVIKASETIGIDWLIVENDTPYPDGLSDVKRSICWLKNIQM